MPLMVSSKRWMCARSNAGSDCGDSPVVGRCGRFAQPERSDGQLQIAAEITPSRQFSTAFAAGCAVHVHCLESRRPAARLCPCIEPATALAADQALQYIGGEFGMSRCVRAGRQGHVDSRYPVIQIQAEALVSTSSSNLRLVRIPGGHWRSGCGAADAPEFAGFQHPQQLACRWSGISPTSSRTGAAIGQLEQTFFLSAAAGKCARSWPNSSLSNRFSGTAAQLMTMNDPFCGLSGHG